MRNVLSVPQKLPVVKEMDAIGKVTFVVSQRARRINLTVKSTGEIRVALPKRASLRDAERFVLSKQKWIKRQLNRIEDSHSIADEYAEKIKNLDIDAAAAGIFKRLEELAAEYDFSYSRVTIRNQKTRWGSCSAKNNLSLNIKLALLPDELRDLILVHELVHTRIKNHGPDFWRELESIYPDARKLDRQVNRFGGLLRIPLG
jgi:predicted metal-dependent hydrolase